jgi:prepilin-type N-terminal cleavage/methylation domain-containing protein
MHSKDIMKAKTHLSQNKSRGGFTLVEMLVVIGMIAALAGISFPVYKSIQKKVEKQQFEMILSSLVRAVDNFETEYNYLPYIGGNYGADEILRVNNGDVTDITSALAGTENVINFKQIVFLECKEAEGSAGSYHNGMVIDGIEAKLYLPHGGEFDRLYFDYNGDGNIVYPYNLSQTLAAKFLYYSFGADNIWNTKPDNIANFD